MNISTELAVGIAINLITLAFLTGIHIATQKHIQENLKELKDTQKENIDSLKEHFQEKFEWLAKKQEKHNNVIERTYCNERKISVLEEKQDVANHRIDDLEEKVK